MRQLLSLFNKEFGKNYKELNIILKIINRYDYVPTISNY